MLGGLVDYAMDPTGMGRYREGLAAQEAAQRKELERVQGKMDTLGQEYTQAGQQIAAGYAPLAGLVPEAVERMQQDYSVAPTAYQYQGNVNQFLDPSIAYQQDQARRSLESSAAARGNLMSGAAAKAIADRAQQIGAQGYADAYARMERDRGYGANQAQQNYLNQVAQQQQRYNQAQQLGQFGLQGLAGQSRGIEYGTTGSVTTRAPSYGQMIDPTAGRADMAAGQMAGQFTGGLLSAAANYAAPGMGDYFSGVFTGGSKPTTPPPQEDWAAGLFK